jgi:flagellar hook-basal body complex protein FliE
VTAIASIGSISSLSKIAATSAANAAAGGASGAMGIDASIGGIDGAGAASGGPGIAGEQAAGGTGQSFVDSLGDALGQLNTQLNAADSSMAQFASGGSSDLHTVMLEMQEASIGLKVGVQVRDRLLEAYQEIMRIQL